MQKIPTVFYNSKSHAPLIIWQPYTIQKASMCHFISFEKIMSKQCIEIYYLIRHEKIWLHPPPFINFHWNQSRKEDERWRQVKEKDKENGEIETEKDGTAGLGGGGYMDTKVLPYSPVEPGGEREMQ